MKKLATRDIAFHIGGHIVKGPVHDPIQNVATQIYQLRNHTLLFDLNHKSHLNRKMLTRHPYSTIVTEHAGRFIHPNIKNTIIKVRNVQRAYWRFIHYYRSLFDLPVIGVTGTCGKTTVKEMIKHILSSRYNVLSTYKSKNSLERNLSYLVGIDDKTDAAVIEMGVAAPNDLIHSCTIFRPQIGIITMIGTDHLEHCGTMENYIKEKAKLLQGLRNRGVLILNADNEYIRKINLQRFKGKVIYFGQSDHADFQAKEIKFTGKGMEFTLYFRGQSYPAFVPGYGEHNVSNALAAIAASYIVGVGIQKAIERIATFQHLEGHLQFYHGIGGSTVIDDSWSSNPTSTEVALKALKRVSNGKKTIAVLGKMELLGKYSKFLHEKIGDKIVELGIDYLITLDRHARHIALRVLKRGMNPRNVFICRHPEEAYQILTTRLLDKDSAVLIKTSMYHAKKKGIVGRLILQRGKS